MSTLEVTPARKLKRGRRISDPVEREAFKAQRRQEEREAIEASVRELMSSEGWRRWVEVRARFHSYSLCNTLLIAHQMPEATYVAGYRAWQGMNRQVRKGERGIRIMAPMTVKQRQGDAGDRPHVGISTPGTISQRAAAIRSDWPETGAGDEVKTLTLFRAVSVFDVDQTDGEPLPEMPGEPIAGDTHSDYLPKLEAFAREIGFTVEYEDLGERIGGYCKRESKSIAVNTRASVNGQVRTLVHELAHALGVSYVDYGRETAEVIVETAAVIVCGSIGLDTSGESIPYLANWGHRDNLAAMREYAGKVDECAARLERALGVRS